MKYAILLTAIIWCCCYRLAASAEMPLHKHHQAKKVYTKSLVIGKSALPKSKGEGEALSRPIGTP